MKILFIIYDNGSYISRFPQNVAYLVSHVNGNHFSIYHQDIYHYTEEHLTKHLDNTEFDYVCIGFIGGYYQYHKVKKICKAINLSKNRHRFKLVFGGHGPSPEPEFFLRKFKADIVVIGEGEKQLEDITNDIPLDQIKGIAYLQDDKYFRNTPVASLYDVDELDLPDYYSFNIEYYRLFRYPNCDTTDFTMPILSGRGCPYNCNFCYRMEKGFRQRDAKLVKHEVKLLQKEWKINYVSFNDELLMTSVSRVEEICKLLKPLNIKWNCNGRLNIAAKHAKLVKLMKEAGCVFINYGIEAFDDNVLKLMNKKLTCKEIIDGIENTKKVGISQGLNVIFGSYGDNIQTLMNGRNLLIKYADDAQLRTIRPVTPYPGSQLYYDAIQEGMLKDCQDFYENKHTNSDLLTCNFTHMTDEEYYMALQDTNKILVNHHHQIKLKKSCEDIDNLYNNKDKNFRGFREI